MRLMVASGLEQIKLATIQQLSVAHGSAARSPSLCLWQTERRLVMGLQQDLGRQVRLHRERSGLSQVDLAEAIGRSVQMLGRIERGRSAPSLDTLEEIARVLQTPVRDFFEPGQVEEGVGRIVQRLSGLTPGEVEWVDQVVAAALGRPRAR